MALALAGCTRAPPTTASPSEGTAAAPAPAATAADALSILREFENAERARTDFVRGSTSDTALGTDPYVLVRAPATSGDRAPGFVGLLRGRSALVELDATLGETARLPAPASPTALAIAPDGEVFVVGELAGRIARYRRARGGGLAPAGSIELPDVRGLRGVATAPEGLVYAVEEHGGRLLTLRPRPDTGSAPPARRVDEPLCHGPLRVMRVADALIVDCLLDHAVVVRRVDKSGFAIAAGETRLQHDGPMWGLDAVADERGLLVAVGGVEDHPLDRTEGSFGFVDSFITLYRVAHGAAAKLASVNTSAFGVVTPKALSLSLRAPGGVELTVAAYGSDRLARITWDDPFPHDATHPLGEPEVTTRVLPPGSAEIDRLPDGSFVVANPLLDAWVHIRPDAVDIVHVDDALSRARSADSRIGEALFFTTLMAPWDRSDGRLSRFTCETCHFEGYVDGRTHHTGRGDVRATTKPLLGLFNNRPHFSRALDPDMTTMVDNEFRVAGAKSDHDPWFSLSPDEFPWTRELGAGDATRTPVELRRALMTFFMDFTHRPNPVAVGRTGYSDAERAGAAVFRDKCESCHQARVVADDPRTRVPFERWEELVLSPQGPIVWACAEYAKTGVLPYVNERGARVVSLRRLYKKYPYFTNGSAKDLESVLARARVAGDGTFLHDGEGAPLGDDERAQLSAFLDLL